MQVTDNLYRPNKNRKPFTLTLSFNFHSATNHVKTTFSHVCIIAKFGNFSFVKLFLLVKVSQYLFNLDKN